MADSLLDKIGRLIARHLGRQSLGYEPYTPSDPDTLRANRPGRMRLSLSATR